MLRLHGSRDKKTFELIGTNSRLDALQAAFLRVSAASRRLERSRREGAARYADLGLGDVVELPADDPGHVYHMYVVRSPERDRIAAASPSARSRPPRTTRRRSISSRAAAPRLGARLLPETERPRPRIGAAALGRDRAEVQERVVEAVLDAVAVAAAR